MTVLAADRMVALSEVSECIMTEASKDIQCIYKEQKRRKKLWWCRVEK